jgi:vacuolar-type H+-ATPase subunit E/Vma4
MSADSTPSSTTRRRIDASALLREAQGLLRASSEALRRSRAFVERVKDIQSSPDSALMVWAESPVAAAV